MTKWAAAVVILGSGASLFAAHLDRKGNLWETLEWRLPCQERRGNPFDVQATVVFVHETGQELTTGMFYDGKDSWRFRFTGTHSGEWTFVTRSDAAALDGKKGRVTVAPAAGDGEETKQGPKHGFIRSIEGNKWAWQTGERDEVMPFVPQLVMGRDLDAYADEGRITEDIQRWLVEHGFSGVHVAVLCRWFDFEKVSSEEIEESDPNPDPRTFEVLENVIRRFHAAGGMVHLWLWGDESRGMTPAKWGINGKADQRLQRYIAARLGPLPGWTAGYGFDLWEWVEGEELEEWHDFMHDQFGWPHLLGARWQKNELSQATESLDYASYEQHQPDYAKYVETIERRSGKPAFSEDRFRVREPSPYPDKDYNLERTRRGLWHSTMAGGVANIWGYLVPSPEEGGSREYPNREEIRTYARFFEGRFVPGMKRANELTDGVALAGKKEGKPLVLIYKEAADRVHIDLSRYEAGLRGVAVDARKPYREIPMGSIGPKETEWQPPYESDWAVALRAE